MILFRCCRLSTVPALPSARESIIELGDIRCSSCSSTIGARGNSPRPVAGHPSAGGERGVGARIRPRCTAPGLVGARRWLAGIAERQVALSTARVLTSQRLDEHPLALVVSNAVRACGRAPGTETKRTATSVVLTRIVRPKNLAVLRLGSRSNFVARNLSRVTEGRAIARPRASHRAPHAPCGRARQA